jgi:hypothetical protein
LYDTSLGYTHSLVSCFTKQTKFLEQLLCFVLFCVSRNKKEAILEIQNQINNIYQSLEYTL